MENEYFFKDGSSTYSDIVHFEEEEKRRDEQEAIFLMNKSLDPISLQAGTYSNGNISLSLGVNYCYKIQFLIGKEFSYLVSKGKWSKKGNELKLYDPCLDYTFRALINPGNLTMISFPNDLLMNKNYYLTKEQ